MDNLIQLVWQKIRDIKHFKLLLFGVSKPFLCRIGIHKMKRGFGWSGDKRMDVCLKCNYTKWYNDKNGNILINEMISKAK